MFRRITLSFCLLIVSLSFVPQRPSYAAFTDGFADTAFRQRWQRADQAVADGQTIRSWVWGQNIGPRIIERYQQSPQASRLVQYFDKARMEISQPNADRTSEWFATNGLLVVELISGKMQIGDQQFEARSAANVPIAGDPDSPSPTYASLEPIATTNGDHRSENRQGQRISSLLAANGQISDEPNLATANTTIVQYESVTGHNVPKVFFDFQQALGSVTNVLGTFGYPITEAYWIDTTINGQAQRVLFQAFERRVLTYNPNNSANWQVEMGNVGSHYYRWRYATPIYYFQDSSIAAKVSEAGTLALNTEGYQPALVDSLPNDPIYPYKRIDRSKITGYQPKNYRLLKLENRYVTLTILPELGGRVYQLINKATGQNLLYQNPVIKASHLGQRGWWLAAGGIEWAAPTEEHGYLESEPWDYRLEQTNEAARVIVSTTERHTGIQIEITIELNNDSQIVNMRGNYRNPTASPQTFQFWMNAMIAPGGINQLQRSLHFVVPTQQMIVHATQDSALPAPQQTISWPNFNQRDLSRYATWNGYIGLFAADNLSGKWAGVYDPALNQGLMLVDLDPNLPGIKTFAFGDQFDRSLYTTDDSDYAELWHGAQATFWDYPSLAAGQSRSFEAHWLPLHDLGDLSAGNRYGAVGLQTTSNGNLIVAIQPSQAVNATPIRISTAGQTLWQATLDLKPQQPLRVELTQNIARGEVLSIEWAGQTQQIIVP
ncbi:DUF5107 domain-containing protein [Herpetosiphon gulosus]|uniref:DUF5107 domain-containing protein n=1 Tax=Herpetosiphon gulosus TaxID=1973496 RepID=A0ABP9WZQ0_9CHLR